MNRTITFKSGLRHVMQVVLMSCFMLLLSNVSEATHFRYGNISWRQVSGRTYQITVSQAWRKSYFTGVVLGGTVNTGTTLEYGDGTSVPIVLSVTTVDTPDDWFYGQFVVTKTYAANGNYTCDFTNCCRVGGLENVSVNDPFLESTIINVGTGNNSPIATISPIVNIQQNTINQILVIFFDPDGNTLTYSLSTATQMGAPSYVIPPGVSINPSTGVVSFNATGYPIGTMFALGVTASDGFTTVDVDFILTVVQKSAPPEFDYSVTPPSGQVFLISPGQTLNFNVKAIDADPTNTVTLNAIGLPSGLVTAPILPATGNPVTSSLTWTPTMAQLGSYVINFTATDLFHIQTSTSVTIVVSMNPVFDVPPTPPDGIDLATQPGTPFVFPLQASDQNPLDMVQITSVSIPATAVLTPNPSVAGNPTNATFSWNPLISNWGVTNVTFKATDSYNQTVDHTVQLIVNTPPVFASTPVTSVVVNNPYTYSITSFDPDVPYGDAVAVIATGMPSWLTFVDNGNGTGSLTGTPNNTEVGTYAITVYLEDIYHHALPNAIPVQTFNITVQPCSLIIDSAVVTNVTCNGLTNGSVHLLYSDPLTTSLTYTWSNGSTGVDLLNVGAGTYTVTISDAYSCTVSSTIAVSQPAPLVTTSHLSNYNGFAITCPGASNGWDTLSTTGGTLPYSTSWSNGASGSSVTGLSGGVYTAITTDANGCKDTVTINIIEPTVIGGAATVSNYNGFGVSCNGGSNGSATLAITGGVGMYTVNWPNGATGTTVSGLTAGNFLVTITDANGCLGFAPVIITQPQPLTAMSTVSNYNGFGVSCNGSSNGSAALAISGGAGMDAVIWSNGAIGASVSNLAAGNYSATITDANGCTDVVTVTLTQPLPLTAVSTVSNYNGYGVSCNGSSNGSAALAVSGGAGMDAITWSNGAIGSSVSGLTAGNYSATITDANGCTDMVTVTITQPLPLTAVSTVSNYNGFGVSCNGSSNGSAALAISGGAGMDAITWSNGAMGTSVSNLAAGNYSATITDANGCTDMITVIITQPLPLTAVSTVSNYNGFGVSCNGSSNGLAALAISGGAGMDAVVWSNGAMGSSVSGLTAGNYSATITDANGCTDVVTVTLSQPLPLTAVSTVSNYNGFGVSCNGSSNGSAALAISGGAGMDAVTWSNGAMGTSISNLTAGNYSATITDANGCTDFVTVTITQPTPLTAVSTVSNYNGFGVSCNGGSNGSATVSLAGGVLPYVTNWSNGSVGTSIVNIPAGIYKATSTDANGCVIMVSVTLSQPTKVVATISGLSNYNGFNVSCFGGSNGFATATVSGGVSPYTYLWSNGTTTSTATGLSAKNYTATAIDLNGCSSIATVTLSQPKQLVETITSPTVIGTYNTSCSVYGDGSASEVTTGGVSPYTVLWNTGATTSSISNLVAGAYSATVKDLNGCLVNKSITLTRPVNCNCIVTPIVPPVSCTGCTKVLDGQTNVVLNAGDNACIVTSFTGNINMNGGNLTICGNAVLQNLSIPNNSKVTVLGTLTLSGLTSNGSNSDLENYGTILITGGLAITGKLNNYKVITVQQTANFNPGSTVVNDGTINVTYDLNNDAYFANNGLVSVGGTFTNNSGSTMLNNCTTLSKSYIVDNNSAFTNNGTITVTNDTRFNSATGTIASGSILQTTDVYLNGTSLSGATTACALIDATGNTQINQATLSGKISLCDKNGFQINNNLTLLSGANINCTSCQYTGTSSAGQRGASTPDASTTTTSAVSIYPNPASNGSEITVVSSVDVASVSVFDNTGRVIATTSGSFFAISNLSAGVYLVKIQDILGTVTVTKLVVQ